MRSNCVRGRNSWRSVRSAPMKVTSSFQPMGLPSKRSLSLQKWLRFSRAFTTVTDFTADGPYSVSADGVSWKMATDAQPATITATDNSSKVIVMGNPSVQPRFSVDAAHTFLQGETPRRQYQSHFGFFRAACYGGGGFVAVDGGGNVWTSERGEYWLPRGDYAKAGEELRSVAFDGQSRFVAVGSTPAGGTALVIAANADPAPARDR